MVKIMKLFKGGNTYCDACEKVIDYTVEEKVAEGWMEWAIEPVKNMHACSLECEYIVTQELM
jgi:hypothetical protein